VVFLPRNHLYRTPIRIENRRPLGAGGFVLCAEIDQCGDLADELDLEAFCRIKDWRRIATRYDKLARNFLAATALVGALYWIKL
jgi:hypothetical protein